MAARSVTSPGFKAVLLEQGQAVASKLAGEKRSGPKAGHRPNATVGHLRLPGEPEQIPGVNTSGAKR